MSKAKFETFLIRLDERVKTTQCYRDWKKRNPSGTDSNYIALSMDSRMAGMSLEDYEQIEKTERR